MQRTPFGTWVLVLTIWLGLTFSSTNAISDTFPEFDNIKPNVSFWTKVYTHYPSTKAIVHDAVHLDIVYDVIDLKAHGEFRARKINRQRMKRAKAKYKKILKQLAAHPNTKKKTARRVAERFGPQASAATFRRAGKRVRCQIGQRDRFKAGLIRSGAYIEQIRAIITSEGLPEELAYLPHVESSFNYQAYSKFGAAGIWQFTRSTGKRFMKVGYVLDERRDPISATHAAAALLKENYEKLGSWPLAITAYNHGATGMARAKQKHGSYPIIFEKYRSRSFKFASRNFYSEFLAAKQVAADYKKYFGDLSFDRPFPTRTVTLDGYVSLDKLCKHYDLPMDMAKWLNPALRPPVFNGQKYVPKGYTFRLLANIESASLKNETIPSALFMKRQKPSHFYTVQRGDTAGRIARTHGVKLSDLVLANNLSRRATIFPRQTLRIPLPGDTLLAANDTLKKRSKSVVIATTESQPEKAPAIDTPKKEPDYPEPVLASVIPPPSAARKPLAAIINTLPANHADTPSAEIVSADVRFERIQNKASRPIGRIQVEVEETLGHFAEWADVRTQRIRRLNGLPFGKKLHLQQKVKIPLDKVTAQAFEEKRYEYHKRLQEDFFSVYRIGEMRVYHVKNGDNLWALSLDKFDIPMWLLKNSNPEVDFAALRLNQTIMVPIIEKIEADES
jgi:membrane-bound lytic murein transglycosylase D